jgi:hypothetical protein
MEGKAMPTPENMKGIRKEAVDTANRVAVAEAFWLMNVS